MEYFTFNLMNFGKKLVRVKEEEEELVLLKNLFYLNSGFLAKHCNIVAIHRSRDFTDTREACLNALRLFSNTLLGKCRVNNGITYAWHGASSIAISQILGSRSDSMKGIKVDGYLRTLYLFPDFERTAIDSITTSKVDENELKHVLFCRLISQHNSSESCTLWYPQIDRHIHPLYVVSIKPGCDLEDALRRPSLVSERIPWPIVLSMLSEIQPLWMMYLIRRAYNDSMEHIIHCQQLIVRVKQLVGDALLNKIITSSVSFSLRDCFAAKVHWLIQL